MSEPVKRKKEKGEGGKKKKKKSKSSVRPLLCAPLLFPFAKRLVIRTPVIEHMFFLWIREPIVSTLRTNKLPCRMHKSGQ